MKYCLTYNKKSKYLDSIDEFKIKVKLNDNGQDIQNFLNIYKDKRVIICLEGFFIDFLTSGKLTEFIQIVKNYENYTFCINPFAAEGTNQEILDNMKKIAETMEGLNFFFTVPAVNWDLFHYMITLGISDIYISEDLGFALPHLKVYTINKNIIMRAYPNICQAQVPHMKVEYHFFIRPEDVPIYEQYIDVLEFYDVENEDLYYKIYAIDKKWFGNLKEIITNLPVDIDSNKIVNTFGKFRVSCERKCIRGKSKCNICSYILEIAKNLQELKLVISDKETAE